MLRHVEKRFQPSQGVGQTHRGHRDQHPGGDDAGNTLGGDGLSDTKALHRQAKRPEQPDGTDRPDWTAPLFRYTAKVSRQVPRFSKHCFLKSASPALYERELRPLLIAYL